MISSVVRLSKPVLIRGAMAKNILSSTSIDEMLTTTMKSCTKADEDEFAKALKFVSNLVLPIIGIIGFCGSWMSIILICSDPILKRLPSNRYLFALAISSGIFMIGLLIQWADNMFQLPVMNGSQAGCKVFTYITYFCDTLSCWLIVGIAFERFVILFLPRWRKRLASTRAVIIVIMFMTIGSFCYNTVPLFIIRLEPLRPIECYSGRQICTANPDLTTAFQVFSFTDIFVACLIPSALVLALNLSVARKFRQYEDRALSSTCGTASTRSTAMRSFATAQNYSRGSVDSNLLFASHAGKEHKCANGTAPELLLQKMEVSITEPPRRRRSHELTGVLLSVTTVFICLNLPSYVWRLVMSYQLIPEMVDKSKHMAKGIQILELIIYTMYYLHHALTFYLYAFHSRAMRKRLQPVFWSFLACDCCSVGTEYEGTTDADEGWM